MTMECFLCGKKFDGRPKAGKKQIYCSASCRIRVKSKRYYEKHKKEIYERNRECQKEWVRKNRLYLNKKQNEWRKNNREHSNEYHRNWRKNHPYYKISSKTCHRRKKLEIFELLGRKCIRCGFSDIRALQIDHINGGGCKDRENRLGSSKYYRLILDEIKNGSHDYQLLCANCNWIKRCENNELNQYSYRRKE